MGVQLKMVFGPCIPWDGPINKSKGYGRTQGKHGRPAHRECWEEKYGPLKSGIVLHHLCENKLCVNLDHLQPLTVSEHSKQHPTILNMRNGGGSAINRAKTHCPAGHEYSPENTYHMPADRRHPNGTRNCRTCKREGNRRRRSLGRWERLWNARADFRTESHYSAVGPRSSRKMLTGWESLNVS